MKRFARTVLMMLCASGAAGIPWTVSCDSTTGDDGCEEPVSRNLQRIMYWGYVAADHWEPNQGVEIGNIYHPVWYADDSIFVHTSKVDRGVAVVGIFNVAIDPATRSFRSVESHAFADVIRDYDYDASTGDLAITYSRAPSDIQSAKARVVGDSLVLGAVIRDAAWFPLSARFLSTGDEIVVYAHDPATMVNGFYYVSMTSPSSDSLLHAVDLSVAEARGFDIAAGIMCFGQTNPSGTNSTISVIDLDGSPSVRAVATLGGAFVSANVHPAGSCAVVSVNDFSEPGSVVGLLDLTSGGFTRLDVKARPCAFPMADFASWNPRGDAFAFSSAAFDGEGGQYPRQLWLRSRITCP